MTMTYDKAVQAIRDSPFNGPKDKLIGQLKPCVYVRTESDQESKQDADSSYFGGEPYLAPGDDWPAWSCEQYLKTKLEEAKKNAKKFPDSDWHIESIQAYEKKLENPALPLSFLGQINLASVQSACEMLTLPKAGTLLFFYEIDEQVWGFDPMDRGAFHVLYYPQGTERSLRETPTQINDDEHRFNATPIGFEASWSLPSWFAKAFDAGEDDSDDLDDETAWETYHELIATVKGDESDSDDETHRMGGWPELIQNDMELECQLASNGVYCGSHEGYKDPRVKALEPGAADWKLILQIASDDDAGWMWGDAGCLYFWAREQESAQGDFSGAWCVLQCH